jgi:putative glutamate/gamma-aminobutyrate antiporter
MLNVSIMASLRNLPIVAEFGLSAVFYFCLIGLFFLIPCALVSAELATGWPKSGGIYIWVREGLGDRWGFMAIWMQWVHNVAWYPVIMSFVAVTLAFAISPDLAENKFYVCGVILVGFWGMTLLNYLGIKTSGWFSAIGVIVGTILPGIFVIFLGVQWIAGGREVQTELSLNAVMPSFNQLGNLAFLAGLFFAFTGLEVFASYAGDVKNPQKNYPRAILLSAFITFVLFMFGSLAIAIVIPNNQINLVAGLMEAFRTFFQFYHLTWILPLMALLLVIGAIAEVNSWIIGPVKGLYATAVHGNLPPFFQKTNKHEVPTRLLLFQAILVTIAALVFLYMPAVSSSFWILTALSAQSYAIMYVLMFIAALRLRYSKPDVDRTYRVPFENKGMWALCIMGILASCFAIGLCFVPPSNIEVRSTLKYVLFLVGGLFVMVIIPHCIHFQRKPHWPIKYRERD